MLNERYVREHVDDVRAALRRRHAGPSAERTLDEWIALDARRRAAATRHDDLARDITMREADPGAASTAEARAARREREAAGDARIVLEAQACRLLMRLPNLPDARVPEGRGSAHNIEVRRWGEPPHVDFAPKRHEELAA